MAFFRVVNDIAQVKELDLWTRKLIYDRIYAEHSERVSRQELRAANLKSLVNQSFGIGRKRLYPCLCEIDQHGLWFFVYWIFRGKVFHTLSSRGKKFYVKEITDQAIILIVNRHEYHIKRDVFLDLWTRLKNEPYISRSDLEKQGLKNTSQIVALLSRLPAVVVHTNPIRLEFEGNKTAQFLKI